MIKLIFYKLLFIIRHYAKEKNISFLKEINYRTPLLTAEHRNELLAFAIENGIPFLAGKFGSTELFAMRTEEFHDQHRREKACEQLCCCAGFFPEDVNQLGKFNNIMKHAASQVDMLEKWDKSCEDYFINKYCINLKGFCDHLTYVGEPVPWSAALKGKRVLVIHPFEGSIRKQYKKREYLFHDPNVLPEFELITIKAVQTSADAIDERFADWFEALDFMKREIDRVEFDVALIGCGAYGLPLGAYVKEKGKVAIHMGAGVQIMFGIFGKRWETKSLIASLKNEYWIYPDETERPAGAEKVENGCYW